MSSPFTPPAYAIRVNIFFFSSLLSSLLVALVAIMTKQWVRHYEQGLRNISSLQIRSRTRQLRYEGLIRWHVRDIVAALPTIMHLSLFLFFFGLLDLLLALDKSIASVVAAFVALGVLFYAFTTIVPMFFVTAPFHSPVANLLQSLATRFSRLFRRSLNRRSKLEAQSEEAAIEDPADLLFGDADPQARIARLQRTLDVDSLTWLMKEFDKTTEGPLLDLCFQKLMTLRSISHNNPSTFYRKQIIQTYRQLVGNSMGSQGKTLALGREQRAGLLCKFLAWFLSLQRTREDELWLRKQLPASESTLPEAVFTMALVNQETDDIVFSRAASCSLYHLHLSKNASCSMCINDQRVLDHFELKASTSQESLNVIADRLSYYLIALSTCVLFYGIQGNDLSPTDARVSNLLTRVTRVIRLYLNAHPDNFRATQPLHRFLQTQFPTHPLAIMWKQEMMRALERGRR